MIQRKARLPRRACLLLVLLFVVSACGFRFGQGTLTQRYDSVSVPYVKGDRDGSFTTALARELATSGAFKYQRDDGDLILSVEILSIRDSRIGYRYDRDSDGSLNERIIPAAGRMTVERPVMDFRN